MLFFPQFPLIAHFPFALRENDMLSDLIDQTMSSCLFREEYRCNAQVYR